VAREALLALVTAIFGTDPCDHLRLLDLQANAPDDVSYKVFFCGMSAA
jgi:hypothetical protein